MLLHFHEALDFAEGSRDAPKNASCAAVWRWSGCCNFVSFCRYVDLGIVGNSLIFINIFWSQEIEGGRVGFFGQDFEPVTPVYGQLRIFRMVFFAELGGINALFERSCVLRSDWERWGQPRSA